jgi:hypothetical protein
VDTNKPRICTKKITLFSRRFVVSNRQISNQAPRDVTNRN